jgi:hypothetical protein
MAKQQPRFQIESTREGGSSVLDELMGGSPSTPTQPTQPTQPPMPRALSQPPTLADRRGPHRVAGEEPAAEAGGKGLREPLRALVPLELADRVRGAIARLQYIDDDWASLNEITAVALDKAVTEAERVHNGGQPFPWRPGRKLRPGRKVGQGQ